jgi:hypothetical protein
VNVALPDSSACSTTKWLASEETSYHLADEGCATGISKSNCGLPGLSASPSTAISTAMKRFLVARQIHPFAAVFRPEGLDSAAS